MKRLFCAVLLSATMVTPAFSDMDGQDMDAAMETATLAGQSAAVFELCGVGDTKRLKRYLMKFARSCGASDGQAATISDVANSARRQAIRQHRNSGASCPISKRKAKRDFDAMADKLLKAAAYNTCG